MPHANRGTKRRCPHCGAAFYDLDRDPVVCPKCQTPYVESQRPPARTTSRPRPAPAEPKEEAEAEDISAFDEDEVLEHEELGHDALEEDEADESDGERD